MQVRMAPVVRHKGTLWTSAAWLALALTLCVLLTAPAGAGLAADVVIVGGGSGGFAAALGAARQGASVIVIEGTDWLGGMFTSAGVAAFDGNRGSLTTGIFAELKSRIRAAYGPDFVSLCSVSDLCFEPSVAARVIDEWFAEYPNIQVFRRAEFVDVHQEGNRIVGVTFRDASGDIRTVRSYITIDGTEYGDVLAASGAPYRLGRDTMRDTGEPYPWTPRYHDDLVQDITYVAILQDFGPDADRTIPEPEGFDPDEFRCTVDTYCPGGRRDHRPVRAEADFWQYGKLPNDKYMLNWPIHGANYEPGAALYDPGTRDQVIQAAKERTLRYIYFIQTVLGHRNIGIAEGEYPTDDGLPFLPYVRESRRAAAEVTLTAVDVVNPFSNPRRPLYQQSVAVIDYYFDHHHTLTLTSESFPRPPRVMIPLHAYIPKDTDGFLVVDKNIGVTHITNGATRMQPAAIYGGYAVGILAAMATRQGVEPEDVPVRDVQRVLLDEGTILMPFRDASTDHPHFLAIQRVGLSGVMVGPWNSDDPRLNPSFAPNQTVTVRDGALFTARALGLVTVGPAADGETRDVRPLLVAELQNPRGDAGAVQDIEDLFDEPEAPLTGVAYSRWLAAFGAVEPHSHLTPSEREAAERLRRKEGVLTRAELAVLIDAYFNPFNTLPVTLVKE